MLLQPKLPDSYLTKVQSQFKEQKPDPLVPPISIYQLLQTSCLGHGAAIAVDEKQNTFTRDVMMRDVTNMAKFLLMLGVKKGDYVVMRVSRPIYLVSVLIFAVNRLGAILALRDASFDDESFKDVLREYRPQVVFLVEEDDHRIRSLQRSIPTLRHIVNLTLTYREGAFKHSALETAAYDGTNAAVIAAEHRGIVPVNLFGFKDLALTLFSSGSLSAPKGMDFTNEELVSLGIYSKDAAGVNMWDKEFEKYMVIVSPGTAYGTSVSTLCPLLGGATAVLAPDLDSENLVYYLDKKPNVIFGVPSILRQMPYVLPEDYDLSFLKAIATGGESYPEEDSRELRAFLDAHGAENARIANGLGAGEIGGLFSTGIGDIPYDPKSVGVIPAGVTPAVIDPETYEELGCNQVGALYGAGRHCMEHYHNLPKLDHDNTIYIKGRRFVSVGVIGRIDADRRVYVSGRDDHFLNDLRLKIYFAHILAALNQSPLVKESYVTKGAHVDFGLAPYAFVVLSDGVAATAETKRKILETARQPFPYGTNTYTLTEYEVPYKLEFLDELPTHDDNSGKVDRAALEQLAKELGADEQAAYAERLRQLRSR